MADVRVVKLFKNGASQAVRLPADFRFEGTEVYAIRYEATGDVTLSSRPNGGDWDELLAMISELDDEDVAGFMEDRPLNTPPVDRDIFGDVE